MTLSVRPLDPDILAALERLAALRRPPGSAGEGEAAEILAAEFEARGGNVTIERVTVHGTYWVPIGLACGLAVLVGWACPTTKRLAARLVAAAGGALAALVIADDLEIGRRPLRRLLWQRTASNVVADFGAPDAAAAVVVHAHHDAARTGLVFHPALAKLRARIAGPVMERIGGTPAPMWGAVAGPAFVALAALFACAPLRLGGTALSAGYLAAMIDIAARPAVPGANDNLSGDCVLLALAASLASSPAENLRLVLLSTGSEESFLEGMQRFGERHFHDLPKDGTVFLCIESVGSPELMLLSGEGLLRRVSYPKGLIRTLSELAHRTGVHLRDPFCYRLATDGQVPLRAGYRTAVISSMDWYKAPSNYHWPSDRPENLDLGSVARAAALAESFVRHLDDLASGSVVDHLDGHAAGLRRAAISPEPGLTGQDAGRPHQPLR